MSKDLNLSGGEISILKALGIGGGDVLGEDLLNRTPDLESAEVIDTLQGLMMMGYVCADLDGFHTLDELKKAHFRVNSGYAKDLKEALDPKPEQKKNTRLRRE